MMREDESDAARIDAELDAEEAARAAKVQALSSPAEPGPPAALAEPGASAALSEPGAADPAPAQDDEQPLWWQNDPRFTSRFKPTR